MSMERSEAIKHFSVRKYAGMTIGDAFAACPAAVRNGLHEQDHAWIKRYSDVPAHEAGARLAVRNFQNPDGTITVVRGRPSEGKTERMELRMTPEQKAKVTERGGSAWVLALIDSAP